MTRSDGVPYKAVSVLLQNLMDFFRFIHDSAYLIPWGKNIRIITRSFSRHGAVSTLAYRVTIGIFEIALEWFVEWMWSNLAQMLKNKMSEKKSWKFYSSVRVLFDMCLAQKCIHE